MIVPEAEVTELATAPGVHQSIDRQRQCMIPSAGDHLHEYFRRGEVAECHDPPWGHVVFFVTVTQLTGVHELATAAEGVDSAGSGDAAGVPISSGLRQ